jgi:phosphatidate cytidylyltransferase
MNKLMQRIVTAAVLLAVLLFVFFILPRSAAIGALGAFIIIAAWEWSGFLALDTFMRRSAYVIVVAAIMATSVWVFPDRAPLQPLLYASLAWWLCAFILVLRYPIEIRRDLGAICGVLVIIPAWVAMVALLGSGEDGPKYVLLVLSVVWAADIGAYFVGRRLGRTKLAPSVSPGKTWEGVIGGMFAAAVAGVAGSWWLGLTMAFFVPMALSVAAISVVGDLTVSMFKRNAKLKDSGNLFPGHGGVLDRVDSVTAAVPLFTLEAIWIGLIAN